MSYMLTMLINSLYLLQHLQRKHTALYDELNTRQKTQQSHKQDEMENVSRPRQMTITAAFEGVQGYRSK